MTQPNYLIRRTGNVIEVMNGAGLEPILAGVLSYEHKTFYRGMMLVQRKKWQANQMVLKGMGQPYDHRADRFRPQIEFQRVPMYHLTDAGGLACPAGHLARVTNALHAAGVRTEYQDLRTRRLPPADFARLLYRETSGGPLLAPQFKHKQDLALATIDGEDGCIIRCPTGYGKTYLASLCTLCWPKSRIMFVTPGLATVRGLARRLSDLGVTYGVCGDGRNQPDRRVTLCSADSLHNAWIEKQDLVIYDEVHTVSDEKVAQLCRFTEAKMIGLSASFPGRGDGSDPVVEGLFGPVRLDVTYQEAVANKAVTPILVLVIEIPPQPGYNNPHDGESWKRWAIWRNDFRNHVIAQAVQQLLGQYIQDPDPQILCMVETIDHAFELRRFLPEFQLVYREPDKRSWAKREIAFRNRDLWFDTDRVLTRQDVKRMQQEFESGKLRRAIATHVWKQGVDFVGLQVLVRCDGGDTDVNNIQIPGRLSRLQDGKSVALLIDTLDKFDERAERRSRGRIADYRRLGWQIVTMTAQLQAGSV